MTHRFADLTRTEGVRHQQQRMGTADQNDRMQALGGPNDRFGLAEAEFIAERDSFYLATVNQAGWPYLQHRGGPKGFVRVLDDRTLGFADFRGNAQYLSVGNLSRDDRLSLFFMDYPGRQRLKLLGRVALVEAQEQPELIASLQEPHYRARIERAFLVTLEAFDWNCPQHITPRFSADEVQQLTRPLERRIQELEAQLANR